MEIRLIEGTKNKYGTDKIVEVKTVGWEKVSITNTLSLITKLFENEDRIYPRPAFRGSNLFLDEILKLYTQHLKEEREEEIRNE